MYTHNDWWWCKLAFVTLFSHLTLSPSFYTVKISPGAHTQTLHFTSFLFPHHPSVMSASYYLLSHFYTRRNVFNQSPHLDVQCLTDEEEQEQAWNGSGSSIYHCATAVLEPISLRWNRLYKKFRLGFVVVAGVAAAAGAAGAAGAEVLQEFKKFAINHKNMVTSQ